MHELNEEALNLVANDLKLQVEISEAVNVDIQRPKRWALEKKHSKLTMYSVLITISAYCKKPIEQLVQVGKHKKTPVKIYNT
jgi:hypothetical protein